MFVMLWFNKNNNEEWRLLLKFLKVLDDLSVFSWQHCGTTQNDDDAARRASRFVVVCQRLLHASLVISADILYFLVQHLLACLS